MGFIIVEALFKGKINQIGIKNVFHVSNLHVNFLSMSKLAWNSLKIQFNLNKCIVKSCDGEANANMPRECNLYEINFVEVHEVEVTNLMQVPTTDDMLKLWHHSLDNLNVKGVHTFKTHDEWYEPW